MALLHTNTIRLADTTHTLAYGSISLHGIKIIMYSTPVVTTTTFPLLYCLNGTTSSCQVKHEITYTMPTCGHYHYDDQIHAFL